MATKAALRARTLAAACVQKPGCMRARHSGTLHTTAVELAARPPMEPHQGFRIGGFRRWDMHACLTKQPH